MNCLCNRCFELRHQRYERAQRRLFVVGAVLGVLAHIGLAWAIERDRTAQREIAAEISR